MFCLTDEELKRIIPHALENSVHFIAMAISEAVIEKFGEEIKRKIQPEQIAAMALDKASDFIKAAILDSIEIKPNKL